MISYALYTNAGNREINEDAVGAFEKGDHYCFVLCDGLGGHGMGDIAAHLVKDVFEQMFARCEDVENFLNQAFPASQQLLMMEQKEQHVPQKMKTTCVALVADQKNAYIGHIGDSRAYIFYHGKVKQRTLDHSIPQMMALSKEIKESEIRNHPQRNLVLRVLGIEWEDNMFELMEHVSLKKGQAFLLCSDGFWELIDESEMCGILKKSSSPKEWLERMTEVVKANGLGRNMDNYSAIAVWNTK